MRLNNNTLFLLSILIIILIIADPVMAHVPGRQQNKTKGCDYCFDSTPNVKKETAIFQHNRKNISFDTYIYTFLYKQQLLKNITLLLESLNIKFVISHGNLIEYERNKYIFHDDDLDIRFDARDQHKWYSFCSNVQNNNSYNLNFDSRFNNQEKQMYNGIQARLVSFENKNNIIQFSDMDIHLDLVCSNISINPWCPYNINFDKIRQVKYLGIDTYCPSKLDTANVLIKEYGPDYLKPNIISIIKY